MWPMPRNRPLMFEDRLDSGDGVEQPDPGDLLLFDAEHFLNDDVGHELDLRVGDGAVEHDARGAEMLAAMEQGDLGGEAGEEERFLHGGIAAADDGDLLAGEKEAVAGGAGADAVADERLLRGQSQPAG